MMPSTHTNTDLLIDEAANRQRHRPRLRTHGGEERLPRCAVRTCMDTTHPENRFIANCFRPFCYTAVEKRSSVVGKTTDGEVCISRLVALWLSLTDLLRSICLCLSTVYTHFEHETLSSLSLDTPPALSVMLMPSLRIR